MSRCSSLCGLPISMCNREKTHCPLCYLRFCEYNWLPFNVQRCKLKSFLEPLAQELEMDLLTLRDRIESQFKDRDMFWGNYISVRNIDKNTLKPVWSNGCPTYRTSSVLSEVYKVIGNGREAVVKINPTFKLPDEYKMRLRDVISKVCKVVGNGREAVVKIDPTFKLPDEYKIQLRDVNIDLGKVDKS